MPYKQIYRIQFNTVTIGLAEQITVDITDMAVDYDVLPEIIYLEGTGDPLHFLTENGDRDPFFPIIARRAEIRFLSTSIYNSRTFSSGTDNRYLVTVSTSSNTLFTGYLLMDDIQERFVNPAFHNETILLATDNIGTLKEQEWMDSAGAAIVDGHFSLLSIIQSCLAKTGLSLNLNICWNIFEEHFNATDSPLAQAFLHSLSFEKEIATKEDCYTILQKIIGGLRARLFQWNGEWWIVRLHEYRTALDTLRRITYDPDGVVVQPFQNYSVAYTIQSGTGLQVINANGLLQSQRRHKFDKATYPYNLPKEIPRNKDFTRGNWLSVLDPYSPLETYANLGAFPVEGKSETFYKATDTDLYYTWDGAGYVLTTAKSFSIDYWTTGVYVAPVLVTPQIRRTYNERGDERSRKIIIPAGTYSPHYIRSENIPVHYKDKFTFSVDWKLGENLTVGGDLAYYVVPVAQILLEGDDGSHWAYLSVPNNNIEGWYGRTVLSDPNDLNASYIGTQVIQSQWQPSQTDELQEWQSVSIEIKPAPVSGELTIVLCGFLHQRFGYKDIYFSNLQFDYIPFIAGTYQKYRGQSDKVEQVSDYKANADDEVAVSDSPKKIFKGALKYNNGVNYVLTGNWTDNFDSGSSGTTRYGEIVEYDVWNQYRKERDLISCTVRGFIAMYSYLLSKLVFADYSATKQFIALREDMNVKRLEGTCDFIEVFDTTETNDYTTDHEFKYEQ